MPEQAVLCMYVHTSALAHDTSVVEGFAVAETLVPRAMNATRGGTVLAAHTSDTARCTTSQGKSRNSEGNLLKGDIPIQMGSAKRIASF